MSILTIVYMSLTVVLIIAGLWYKRSKFLYTIQMLWMWILAAFNTGGMDYSVHTNIYAASAIARFRLLEGNVLYSFLCKIFYTRGFEFYVMNGVISTGIFIFLYQFIAKKSKNPCFVASLFFIYPLGDCIIQKRWFLANMVVLAGIEYFFKNKSGMKNRVFLILSILIAYEIHVGSLAYLLLAILLLMPEKYMKQLMKIVIIGAYISVPVMPILASRFFPAGKVQLYFVELRLGIRDFLFWTFFHLVFAGIYWYIYRKEICAPEDSQAKSAFIISRDMNVYLPLYYYEPTFIRFFRGILLYQYIGVSNIQPQSHVYKKQVLLCTGILCFTALGAFTAVYVIAGAGFAQLILPIFENNIVLEWLGEL